MATFIKPFTDTKERSNKFGQNFDRKKISLTKKGQTFNVYDWIQAGREDTEIYPTLEKYGNLEVMERPAQDIVADFSQNLQLRDLMEQDNKLMTLFESLPLKERKKFNNNFYEFKRDGLDYYQKQLNEKIARQQQYQQQQQQQNGGENNEQK